MFLVLFESRMLRILAEGASAGNLSPLKCTRYISVMTMFPFWAVKSMLHKIC